MEIKSEKNGESKVIWKPFILDTFGTDYLRFSYKKTNPVIIEIKIFKIMEVVQAQLFQKI